MGCGMFVIVVWFGVRAGSNPITVAIWSTVFFFEVFGGL